MNQYKCQEQEQELRVQTYRFIFSNEFTEELTRFAKVHQYDERKQFKEAWLTWINEETINPLINEEAKRLRNSGFDGDVLVKMFKSARYYFRNKSENKHPLEQSDKKERKHKCIFGKGIGSATMSESDELIRKVRF
jgi:hypothetical protein